MSSNAIFITHRTAPGQRAAARAVWQRHMQPAIAANPEHLAYWYCFDDSDPDVIHAFQLYTSDDAAAAFLRTPAYAAYVAEVTPFLAGPPAVQATTPMWSKTHADS